MSDPDPDPSKGSFWTTIPGLLTGIATLLTAIVGIASLSHKQAPDKGGKPPPGVSSPTPSSIVLADQSTPDAPQPSATSSRHAPPVFVPSPPKATGRSSNPPAPVPAAPALPPTTSAPLPTTPAPVVPPVQPTSPLPAGHVVSPRCDSKIRLSPAEGGPTTPFAVDGSGFLPNGQQVNIIIDGEVSNSPGYTGETGAFTTLIQPPTLSSGTHEVRAAHISFIPAECQATATYVVR